MRVPTSVNVINTKVPVINHRKSKSIEILEKEYGGSFVLNSGFFETKSISISIEYYFDKNGNIIIKNYDQMKYKYKYIVCKSMLQQTKKFTMRCLELMNVDYNLKPFAKQGFSYPLDFNDVFYGIQDSTYEVTDGEISDEEFNKPVPFHFGDPILMDLTKPTFYKDIDNYVTNVVPARFFTDSHCLFFSKNYIEKLNNFNINRKKITNVKRINTIFK